MPLNIIRDDITRVRADAIVNTANPKVAIGAGTDQAIYEAAGREQLLSARARIGEMRPGQAAYTPAFKLDANYIIHTVGPVWQGGGHHERETVAECYRNSLDIACELGCETVAFPLISSGTYGFPKDEALKIAISEISSFLFSHDITVFLVVYDRESFVVSGKAFSDIRSYISESEVRAYADTQGYRRKEELQKSVYPRAGRKERTEESYYSGPADWIDAEADILIESDAYRSESFSELSLDDIFRMKEETFQQVLFRIIDRKGLSDPEVYKRANIDRKLFSKIRSDVDYMPSKRTALALIIGLQLNIDEAADLLQRAGYSFSPGNVSDITVRYCIEHNMYDIHTINCYLFDFGQKTLG